MTDADRAAFEAPLADHAIEAHTVTTAARAYGRQRAEAAALCERYRPDIVHTHGAHADVVAAHVGEATGAATVTTLHGLVGGSLRNRAYEWLQRRACRDRDAVVAVSRSLATVLIVDGAPANRMHVVRNAWCSGATAHSRTDARRLLRLPAHDYIIGWVGRISPEKGLDVLLAALDSRPAHDVRVAVLGDGVLRLALSAQASRSELGQLGRISWHGQVAHASRFLPAFDVLVMSSHTEGTPMVLLEAMAAEVPVITTAVGGIPDIVGADEAVLVARADPIGMRAAIDAVRRDPGSARRRALAAHARLQQEGDVGLWAARYSSVYAAATTVAHRRKSRAPNAPTAPRAVPASPAASAP
jgi:glycosyltransferase involved in cell wall biosynthesis